MSQANCNKKITDDIAIDIIERLCNGVRICDIVKELDVSYNIVSSIKYKKAYTRYTENIEFAQ